MHRPYIAGFLAGILALSLTACQSSNKEILPDTTEQQYMLVESASVRANDVFLPESPAAANASALSPADIQDMAVSSISKEQEVRAVWVSYLEMDHLLSKQTAAQFQKNFQKVLQNAENLGLNTVIVQVRPFGDALYASDYFPWSYLITGKEGNDPWFDPLEIMITETRKKNMRIEAWVNPYRIRNQGSKQVLSSDNPAKQWQANGNRAVITYDGVTSYNPASKQAQELIINGIAEIVRGYDVDGIHIDDYFYPTTDTAFDQADYTAYKESGGTLSLDSWRRFQVETLIKGIYSAVKKEDPDCLFGISPQSSVDTNYNKQYLDVKKMLSNPGYCDYMCPQIYFGYENESQPYLQTLKSWNQLAEKSDVDLYVGLSAYKIGVVDTWAGNGEKEWVKHTDRMKKMVADARKMGNYGGFVLYRYDSIFSPDQEVKAAVEKEMRQLERII